MLDKKTMLLYAVTDRAWTGRMTLLQQVEAALENGVTCLQLREKDMSDEDFLNEAIEIGAMCRRHNVTFIINDNVDVAVKCGADGVHVGQEDMEAGEARKRIGDRMILGVSVHTVEEARQAVRDGADYLGLGAVFSTSTKQDADVMPRQILEDICAAVDIPTVAIGGITKNNIMELAGSGVDGIAVVSAIFGAPDPGEAAAELRILSEKMVENREETR